MKTLDRYISGTFLKNLLITVLSLSFLFFIQELLVAFSDHQFSANQLMIYHLLDLPRIAVQMIPPSVLISTVLTLSGLNRTNELVACYSIGVGLRRITAVLLSLSFMICCASLILQDRILPPLYKRRTTFYWRKMKNRPDFYLDVKQDKIWYRSKNLIYNLQTFDSKSQTIVGMAIYTFDDRFNLSQLINAEKAVYTPNGWKLLNGTVTLFSNEDPFPRTQRFADKGLIIEESPVDFQEIEKEVDSLRLKDLWHYVQKTRTTGTDTKLFEVKFHSKISISFIPLVMCILGVPFATRSRREGGAAKDLGLCLVVTFFYWLFYSVGLSLGTNGALPPWLAAWLPSVIFAALAVALIARKT